MGWLQIQFFSIPEMEYDISAGATETEPGPALGPRLVCILRKQGRADTHRAPHAQVKYG